MGGLTYLSDQRSGRVQWIRVVPELADVNEPDFAALARADYFITFLILDGVGKLHDSLEDVVEGDHFLESLPSHK